MEKTEKKPKIKRLIAVMSVLLVLIIILQLANAIYSPVLRVAFSGSTTDEDLLNTVHQTALDMNIEIEEEGAVLLKNDNNTLPINTTDKVKINLFGVKSIDLTFNATGSAASDPANMVSLKEGLESANFEINPDLYALISSQVTVSSDTSVHEGATSEAVYELGLDLYTGSTDFSNLKSYSNYAVVVIGRVSGEGGDLSRTGFGADSNESYLELSAYEKALLTKIKSYGFTTIVLVNSTPAMQLGFLNDEQYGVSAALWIGGPGQAGTIAVGELLNGTAVPSGRLVDTYAYDLTTSSTYYSADNYVYAVAQADGTYKDIGGWTNYSEGIYLGYKWYETADAEGYWDSVGGYDSVVQYPFGYGLSYATFSQKFSSPPVLEGNTWTFNVEVTNLSTQFDAKDVVQIYVETPYINGSVEKSKVVLCAFGKTDVIPAGGNNSETVTLTVNVDDIASYDENADGGNGAYVLDKGDYIFYLSDNAHSWKNADTEKVYTYNLANEIVYSGDNPRPSDLVAASNRLGKEQTGGVFSLDNGITVLSRADQFSNAAVALNPEYETVKIGDRDVKAQIVTEDSAIYAALETNVKNAGSYQGTFTDTTTDAHKKYNFEDMYGKAYDDPAWNEFISQLTIDEMNSLFGNAGWSSIEIESIGKPYMQNLDGPFGISNYITTTMGIQGARCVSYTSIPVLAATFNLELMERFGETIGLEGNASGTAGWYAPGSNIHRSPFSGRNAEYFSEDPFLSGKGSASVIKGAQGKGMLVHIKHFAFNDIEANRTNMENCWMTEQTARENILRVFEIAIKEGQAHGIMVSYMFINGQWVGANYSLNGNIVRGEWGFQGLILTDNFAGSWMGPDKAIMGGTDMILSQALHAVSPAVASTNDGVLAMKEASYHSLYAISAVQNNRIVPIITPTDWWKIIWLGSTGILGGAFIALGVILTLKIVKSKKTVKAEKKTGK